MYVLKLFLLFCFFLVFMSCSDERKRCSVAIDLRCNKIHNETLKKGKETGVCYSGPLLRGGDAGAVDPDPEACEALIRESYNKCDALPPPGLNDVVQSSGSTFYKDGKLVMKDGEPVCVPDKKP